VFQKFSNIKFYQKRMLKKLRINTCAKSFSISFFPKSSFHFWEALVKAFFFDWDLFYEGVRENPQKSPTKVNVIRTVQKVTGRGRERKKEKKKN